MRLLNVLSLVVTHFFFLVFLSVRLVLQDLLHHHHQDRRGSRAGVADRAPMLHGVQRGRD